MIHVLRNRKDPQAICGASPEDEYRDYDHFETVGKQQLDKFERSMDGYYCEKCRMMWNLELVVEEIIMGEERSTSFRTLENRR